jgi:hypothetical protein
LAVCPLHWDRGFEFPSEHGLILIFLCCYDPVQVEVFLLDLSLIQGVVRNVYMINSFRILMNCNRLAGSMHCNWKGKEITLVFSCKHRSEVAPIIN